MSIFSFPISLYHGGVKVAKHRGAALGQVASGVDVEAVDAGAESSDGTAHLDVVDIHLGEHNSALNSVSLHDGHCRLGLNSVDTFYSLETRNLLYVK